MTQSSIIEVCQMLVALEDDLRDAAQIANVRHRLIASIGAARAFVEKCAPGENLFAPFLQLEGALCDLDKGTVATFLQPIKSANRHERSFAHKQLIGLAVYYTEYLMLAGMNLEQSARFVASELVRHSKLKPNRRSAPWKTVKTWRDELSRPSASWEIVAIVKAYREEQPAPQIKESDTAKKFVVAHLEAQLPALLLE